MKYEYCCVYHSREHGGRMVVNYGKKIVITQYYPATGMHLLNVLGRQGWEMTAAHPRTDGRRGNLIYMMRSLE